MYFDTKLMARFYMTTNKYARARTRTHTSLQFATRVKFVKPLTPSSA